MRVVANSVPKSGTHLLVRLLILLGVDLVDFGGIAPHRVEDGRFPSASRRMRDLLGLRQPENVMGIGPHLVEDGRLPVARRILRASGREKVTVGIDFPRHVSRGWLSRRLGRVPEGCFVTAHCVHSPELASLFAERGMRVVCIVRDPRDVAVSQVHYIKQRKGHFAHGAFVGMPSDRERLLVSIRGGEVGGRRLQSLEERYRQFLGWGGEPGAVVVRFEDLVGPEGGGSVEARRLAVGRVAAHVGVGVDEGTMGAVEEGLFGVGRTFRRGRLGGWREEFGEEHVEASKEVAGGLLVELGYEADTDW